MKRIKNYVPKWGYLDIFCPGSVAPWIEHRPDDQKAAGLVGAHT